MKVIHTLTSPVLRISPNELHIIDADFYDVLFSQSRRNKAPTWSQAFGNPDSIFGTIDHHQHRIRRAPLNPYFSKGSIRTLEPLIREDISRLVSVFRDYQKTKEPVPLKAAFAALTSDIVTQFCFMMQSDYIEADGFNVMVLKAGEGATDALHVELACYRTFNVYVL
ncbi:putative Trichodiene oxygenase [Glarea lozoyensis 74030]|uniref:Putative Trichodiene oxygenase n=1 Tax=Glarea lozoyensis (strain ATCC 74030 / MF5533) TaxID=1104152 RepID=H0EF58_GLAL7|nr:putative Trichodiene oxygenase [Glarea lozoyensis 74030]